MDGWNKDKKKGDGWRRGRLVFSAKTERTVFFALTVMMALYGIAVWLTGG